MVRALRFPKYCRFKKKGYILQKTPGGDAIEFFFCSALPQSIPGVARQSIHPLKRLQIYSNKIVFDISI
jgi:hypothetical protein